MDGLSCFSIILFIYSFVHQFIHQNRFKHVNKFISSDVNPPPKKRKCTSVSLITCMIYTWHSGVTIYICSTYCMYSYLVQTSPLSEPQPFIKGYGHISDVHTILNPPPSPLPFISKPQRKRLFYIYIYILFNLPIFFGVVVANNEGNFRIGQNLDPIISLGCWMLDLECWILNLGFWIRRFTLHARRSIKIGGEGGGKHIVCFSIDKTSLSALCSVS